MNDILVADVVYFRKKRKKIKNVKTFLFFYVIIYAELKVWKAVKCNISVIDFAFFSQFYYSWLPSHLLCKQLQHYKTRIQYFSIQTSLWLLASNQTEENGKESVASPIFLSMLEWSVLWNSTYWGFLDFFKNEICLTIPSSLVTSPLWAKIKSLDVLLAFLKICFGLIWWIKITSV